MPVRAALGEEERWWSISGRPIINEYGQFHGFRGSGTDLTEMRRSQAALIGQFRDSGLLRVADVAMVPEKPVKPN